MRALGKVTFVTEGTAAGRKDPRGAARVAGALRPLLYPQRVLSRRSR